MIDLKKIKMPSAVMVDGVFYEVKTDFQYWLMFEDNLKNQDYNFYFIFENKMPPIEKEEETLSALLDFYQPKKTLPRAIGKQSHVTLMDYEFDSDLIYSAFYEQYKIDLLNPDLHLHIYKFQALMSGLHGTRFNEIIQFRSYDKNDKTKYEDSMEQLKQSWAIPVKETESDKKAREEWNALFDVKK